MKINLLFGWLYKIRDEMAWWSKTEVPKPWLVGHLWPASPWGLLKIWHNLFSNNLKKCIDIQLNNNRSFNNVHCAFYSILESIFCIFCYFITETNYSGIFQGWLALNRPISKAKPIESWMRANFSVWQQNNEICWVCTRVFMLCYNCHRALHHFVTIVIQWSPNYQCPGMSLLQNTEQIIFHFILLNKIKHSWLNSRNKDIVRPL